MGEVQGLGAELDTVQSSVVRRVGEVCSHALQEWKDGRVDDVSRLEEQFLATQEASAEAAYNFKLQSSKLSVYARAVDQLQLKCQHLPDPDDDRMHSVPVLARSRFTGQGFSYPTLTPDSSSRVGK